MSNWYKIAKLQRPYKAYLQKGARDIIPLGDIEVLQSDNEEKEKSKALRKAEQIFGDKISHFDRDYVLKVILDKNEWERLLEIERYNKEKAEETPWWDK